MSYNLQEQEEIDFHFGPRLWDADPDVCCAAFQLGACEHTESFDPEYDSIPFVGTLVRYDATTSLVVHLQSVRPVVLDDEPF